MFTGLVQGTGSLSRLPGGRGDQLLLVRPDFPWDGPLSKGESVMVSGVCLTVQKALPDGPFETYASMETLRLTSLSRARKVNLERALRLADRLGGHLVSGHVDCLAALTRKEPAGKSLTLAFRLPREFTRFLAPKGSVALDGVSLTVNAVSPGAFTVNAIPETLSATTLSSLAVGDSVNLETDIIAKYLDSLLSSKKDGGLTLAKLLENGL